MYAIMCVIAAGREVGRDEGEIIAVVSESMSLGIVVERREIDNPWQSHVWSSVAVIPGAPEIDQWRLIAEGKGWKHYHAGTLNVEIFRTETEGYRLNLMNEPPMVYVVLRYDDEDETAEDETDEDATPGIVPFLATVCPFEAQAYLDGDEDLVEPIPMPDVVAAWLHDFVKNHHVDEPKYKRKRTPHEPRKGGPDEGRRLAPDTGPRG